MSDFQKASVEHIRRLGRLIDRGGVARIKRLYQQGQAELERKLARAVGKGSAPFTVHQHRVMLAQVRQGQMEIARRMGDASAQATVETQKDALGTLVRSIKTLETRHGSGGTVTLPIEEASRFRGVLDRRKTSLLRQNQSSMATYGAGVVKKIEETMSVSLVSGDTTAEAVDKVAATADVELWKAERIVRTEQAWAYNATQRDGIEEAASALGDLWMRWTELVDDESGKPLDDRVGEDSIALHGQVAKPGQLFQMPPDADVSDSLSNWQGAHPPNRPHDRATLMPWRPSWDVPGWQLVGGFKQMVRPGRRGL